MGEGISVAIVAGAGFPGEAVRGAPGRTSPFHTMAAGCVAMAGTWKETVTDSPSALSTSRSDRDVAAPGRKVPESRPFA